MVTLEFERISTVGRAQQGRIKQRVFAAAATGRMEWMCPSRSRRRRSAHPPRVARVIGAVAKGIFAKLGLEIDGRPLTGEFVAPPKLSTRWWTN
jgi:hypothetical protein